MGGRNTPGDDPKPRDHDGQQQQQQQQQEPPSRRDHNIAEEIGLDGNENDNGRGLPD